MKNSFLVASSLPILRGETWAFLLL